MYTYVYMIYIIWEISQAAMFEYLNVVDKSCENLTRHLWLEASALRRCHAVEVRCHKWFMENRSKLDDLGGTPILGNLLITIGTAWYN